MLAVAQRPAILIRRSNLALNASIFQIKLDPLPKSVFDDVHISERPVAVLKQTLVSSTRTGLHVDQVLLSTRSVSGGCAE